MLKISEIVLNNFRNFSSKKINFSSDFVAFVGENGAGKTNILESLTLLGKGSLLRNSDFNEMILYENKKERKQYFSVYAKIKDHDFIEEISVSFDLSDKKKKININGEILGSRRQSDVKNYFINFIFLTPQLEQLFISGKTARREYLDHIVCDLDIEHSTRINAYQKLLKERLLILQKYSNQIKNNQWLDIVENKIVELAIAIASARIEAIDFFNKAILSFSSNFPKPKLEVIGDVEKEVMKQSSVKLEEFYKKNLEQNRDSDLENFKTEFGVHRSDFNAVFSDQKIIAANCSTGEQKSIMLSITLARAKIAAFYKNQPTILIFDEIVSHLDFQRRNDLFEEIKSTKLQSFFSATSVDLFLDCCKNKEIQIIEIF
jgi:DNA replication and repair protein RecF